MRAGEERDSYSGLTERKREILKLVAEGYTNNQIGELLFISPKTVDTHRTHVMDKLNLHSRAELVKYAMRRGLLEDRLAGGDARTAAAEAAPRDADPSKARLAGCSEPQASGGLTRLSLRRPVCVGTSEAISSGMQFSMCASQCRRGRPSGTHSASRSKSPAEAPECQRAIRR